MSIAHARAHRNANGNGHNGNGKHPKAPPPPQTPTATAQTATANPPKPPPPPPTRLRDALGGDGPSGHPRTPAELLTNPKALRAVLMEIQARPSGKRNRPSLNRVYGYAV